ncbi:hypothetical protein Tco_0954238 [Tanacetum coccineum]|uniref:Uncharacterized protein n=1 Tax=Tanacetum coccineum TaxID=301880 RepID=A0ABQ5E3S6_9ASTR
MSLASSSDKLSKTIDELMSTPIDFSAYIMNGLKITNLTQETLLRPAFKLLKGTRTNFAELEYDFEECYKALSKKLGWDNPEGGDYPFDLTKPLPSFMNGNHQMVPVDYFFNNDLKYLQGGILTMIYTTSTTNTKAAQYDLQGIEDMVQNIWSPINVSYDKYALWGISHWRKQRKTFYAYARGLEYSHDVYSTKYILAVTRVEVMRKHGLTNLSGDDVSDFSIALQMFTRSMVIQKRVEDLQLGVKSYQKKINVTKPETTRLDIKKRDPYTPYQDPQGFIYVDATGLRVADSYTSNHLEDDFTQLETIQRPYSVIRKRIIFELEGETFEPERGAYGGDPSLDLLQSFLNLGRDGDWLTLSNRGGADVPKALIKPVGEKSKAAGKRKLAPDALQEGSHHRARKALGQVNGLHNEYSRLLHEERKWDNYEQTMSLLCVKVEEVAKLKEPFILEKMSGYRTSSKDEYDRAREDMANASYPFLSELTSNPYASIEQLLSMKPRSLRSSNAP